MNSQFLGDHKIVHLSTKAMRDLYQGSYASDVINMQDWQDCVFVVNQTSGVGQAELSIKRADDVTPTTTAGAPTWRWRKSTSPDVWNAWTTVASSSGFLTGITPDKVFELHIRGDEVGGSSDYKYIFLNADQVTDSECDVDIIAILFNGRYQNDIAPRTSLV